MSASYIIQQEGMYERLYGSKTQNMIFHIREALKLIIARLKLIGCDIKKTQKKKSQWGVYLIALSKRLLLCILIDMQEEENSGDARCSVLQTPRPYKHELAQTAQDI